MFVQKDWHLRGYGYCKWERWSSCCPGLMLCCQKIPCLVACETVMNLLTTTVFPFLLQLFFESALQSNWWIFTWSPAQWDQVKGQLLHLSWRAPRCKVSRENELEGHHGMGICDLPAQGYEFDQLSHAQMDSQLIFHRFNWMSKPQLQIKNT